jgi:hypothetical protein
LHGLGDELWSIVEPDVTGNTPEDEEVRQNVDHIDGLKLAGDADRQAFVGFAGPLAGLPQLVHQAFASVRAVDLLPQRTDLVLYSPVAVCLSASFPLVAIFNPQSQAGRSCI